MSQQRIEIYFNPILIIYISLACQCVCVLFFQQILASLLPEAGRGTNIRPCKVFKKIMNIFYIVGHIALTGTST